MDQLQLQWRKMNKEIIKEELFKFGDLVSDKNYFFKLGNRFALLYNNYFKYEKSNLNFNSLRLEDTILNLEKYVLIPKDYCYLNFNYNNRLKLDSNSYVDFDLKGLVTDLYIRGVKRKVAYKTTIDEIINFIKDNYCFKDLEVNMKLIYDKLYLISLIYNYTYQILEEKDIFIAGMFKIAYHDLLMIARKVIERQNNLNYGENTFFTNGR